MKIEHFTSNKTKSISWQRTWNKAGEEDEWPAGSEGLTDVFEESELIGVDLHQILYSGLSLINAESLSCHQIEGEQRSREGEHEEKHVEKLENADESENPGDVWKHNLPQVSKTDSNNELHVEQVPRVGNERESEEEQVDCGSDEVSLVEMSYANTSKRAVMITTKNAHVTNWTMVSSWWRHGMATVTVLVSWLHYIWKN